MSCPWLPGRPRFSSEVRELVGFGLGVTGFTVMDTLSRSADRVALGYFNGAGSLGYFQNAFLLYFNVLNIVTEPHAQHRGIEPHQAQRQHAGAQEVLVRSPVLDDLLLRPGICRARRHGSGFRRHVAGTEMGTCRTPSVRVCHPRHRQLRRTHDGMASRRGRALRPLVRWGVFSAVCQLVALMAGLPFGAMGVAVAYTVAMFCLFVPALVYAGHPIGIGVRDVLSATGRRWSPRSSPWRSG